MHVIHRINEAPAEQSPPCPVHHCTGKVRILSGSHPLGQSDAIRGLCVGFLAAKERRWTRHETIGSSFFQGIESDFGVILDADLIYHFRFAGGLDYIEPGSSKEVFNRQVDLLQQLEKPFHQAYKSESGVAHRTMLDRAVKLMNSQQKQAFDLSRESYKVRDAYRGTASTEPPKRGEKNLTASSGSFGQGCLMARRLVEAGVPFVEVVMGDGVGWDTHRDNFPRVKSLSLECDTAMSALIEDLQTRGLLDTTLVVWMGEFGRSPQCGGGGRNHWSKSWSSVVVGGGIKGGQVIGKTDKDAAAVVERPINVTDFLGTICTVLGIDYKKKNHPPGVDRPIPIVDTSKEIKVISELLS